METISFQIPSADQQLTLSGLMLKPVGTPRGIVQCSHGMAEHKERYMPIMEYLCQHGFVCVIHDHRGHGDTVAAADYGYFFDETGEAIVNDLFAITRYIRQLFPKQPLFLLGHSMGTLVARCYLQEHDQELQGVILSGAPSYNTLTPMALGITAFLRIVQGPRRRSQLLQALSFGGYDRQFKPRRKNGWLSKNTANVEAYNNDEKCGFVFTINGFQNLFHLMQRCYTKKYYQLRHPSLPILMIGGEKDPVIGGTQPFITQKEFLEGVGYADIEQKLYPDLRHEIFQEKEADHIYQDVLLFIETHLSKEG